jgi:hypothetical protein
MGKQPLAERMDRSEAYPLVLLKCSNCLLVQLSYIVDQREMFPEDHPYTTGTNRMMREHCADLASMLMKDLHQGDTVVDIGANDGTFLAAFGKGHTQPLVGDLNLVAVEPTGQANKCLKQGFATYQGFFTSRLASKIVSTHGHAAVVTATNVLAHVPDPHDFIEGIATLIGDKGRFISESHDLASITDNLQIDTIYHEHLRYYSVASLSRLLAMHGLDVLSSERIPTYGGSFRVKARKARGDLGGRAQDTAGELHDLLSNLTQAGNSVYGISAATRAVPLIHFAQIAPFITLVCETKGSEKIGSMIPGTSIPIVDEAVLVKDQPEYALLFSYHLTHVIVPKLRQMGYRGKFITPLPEPRIDG